MFAVKVRLPAPDYAYDDALIEASLAASTHPELNGSAGSGFCPWCGHAFHGVPCKDSGIHDRCGCDSSVSVRDDTWRPVRIEYWREQRGLLMDATGCDGYTATYLKSPASGVVGHAPGTGNRLRILRSLQGCAIDPPTRRDESGRG